MPKPNKRSFVLDAPQTWPPHLTDLLQSEAVTAVLQKHDWIDEVVKKLAIKTVLQAVEEHAESVGLSGFHCTKQLPEKPYAEAGLRTLSFDEHHAEFRDVIRRQEQVTPDLFKHIDAGLTDWQHNHTGRRERMLWFCLTQGFVADRGTRYFFKYFGGEAVYFGFMQDSAILALLESLGEPVVVEARIWPRDLTVYHEFALGRAVVSHFAPTVNPDFNPEPREGHIKCSVKPEDIIAVHPHQKFLATLHSKN